MKLNTVFLLMLTTLIVPRANGAKILTLIPAGGPSLFHLVMSLLNELANRGHEITLITSTQGKSNHPNITVYSVNGVTTYEAVMKEYTLSSLTKTPTGMWSALDFMKYDEYAAELFLGRKEIKDMISKGIQYDIAMVDMVTYEWATAITPLVAKHTMYLSPCSPISWMNPAPAPPSYVPTILEPMPEKMNFYQRLCNALVYAVNRIVFHTIYLHSEQKCLSRLVPHAPPIKDVLKKVHFVIANEDPVMHSPRPSVPSVVNAGCWHCNEAKPLPKDLEDFIQQSGDNGCIMFSLGSNVKSEFLPAGTIQNFLKAFGRLKQNVIWKFGEELENIPKNVKIIDWMPQQDMLGHEKLRLFMSHGGLLSMQEAVYHGKPVIGFPVFFDQHANVARIKEIGMGDYMSLLDITPENVYDTITNALNNKRYAETAKKLSNVMKDQPEHPMERAVFWIEYFIRHDGAPHLRNAGEDLNFFQYFLLDVIVVMLVVLGVVGFVLLKATRLLFRKIGFCSCKSTITTSVKKTK